MTTVGNAAPPELHSVLSTRAERLTGSVIDASTSLLQRQTRDIVRLAMGSPASSSIPTSAFTSILQEVAADPGAFDYAATEGDPLLRDVLLEFLDGHGVSTDPERLLITTGGMQGLDLACKVLIDPGDIVIVESPTYTNATATIASYQGQIVEVPCDDHGMQVDLLADLVADVGQPKLIYTIPTFQNPAGTTLPLERRHRLLELAAKWGAVVLEDDPYSMLRFSGSPLPTLQQLARGRVRVVSVHTFSKIIAPGLRVGWLVADADIVDLMINARQGMDTCTNTLQQRAVARYLADGELTAHLAKVRVEYATRKHALQEALQSVFADIDAHWTDPDGGFFLWLTLPTTFDAEAAFPTALEEGVAYVPGNAFSPGKLYSNALRLAFSAEAPDRQLHGVQRLRRAVDRHRA